MAATNETSNLQLSQFVGSDKPDWLTDYNGDMLKIDTAYGAVSATAEQAASNAQAAATSAAAAAEDAAEALSGISGAIEAATAATTAAQQATQQATSAVSIANGAAATAQGAAGDATQALSVANNAKVTAENAQAAAAQAATDAAASATAASTAQAAATQAATDAASAAAIASGMGSRVTAIEECVPSNASASNKFATAADIPTVGAKPISGTSKTDYFDYIGTWDATNTMIQNLLNSLRAVLLDNLSKITENTRIYLGSLSSSVQYDARVFKLERWTADNNGTIQDLHFTHGEVVSSTTCEFLEWDMYISLATTTVYFIETKRYYMSGTPDTGDGKTDVRCNARNWTGSAGYNIGVSNGFAINW